MLWYAGTSLVKFHYHRTSFKLLSLFILNIGSHSSAGSNSSRSIRVLSWKFVFRSLLHRQQCYRKDQV